MNNKIKFLFKVLLFTVLLAGAFYSADRALADNQEPILIEISDTDIGTEAFEQLISYGNGGHAAMGAILGSAQNMLSNPGIGFSIGSGGNGYRPTILIAVWTDQPFSVSSGLDTIKSHFNVPSNPITTNGDCAIACDGTHEEPVAVQQPAAAVVPEQTSPDVVEDQPSAPMPTPQVEVSTPQVLSDNTQQYTNPTVVVETNSAFSLSSLAPYVIIADSAKPIVNKTKIAPKIKKTKIAPKIIKSKKIKLVLTKAKQPIK
jgi:hypothetical protein